MIAIGCDHAGYNLKLSIIKFLEDNKIMYKDYGTYDELSTDYPIYAKHVSNAILNGECSRGILICGTGIGISISANKIKGIRCALCNDVFSAKMAREHNDANIIAFGARVLGEGHVLEILKAFLESNFSNQEKHIKRLKLIEENNS